MRASLKFSLLSCTGLLLALAHGAQADPLPPPAAVTPPATGPWTWKPNPARMFPSPVELPPATGPRPGELALRLTLPDEQNMVRATESLVGDRALFLILDNGATTLNLGPNVGEAAARADAAGPLTLVVRPGTGALPAPLHSLRDEKKLSAGYLGGPALLAIDKAGWLRDVQPLPTDDPDNVRLRYLLSTSGDPTPPLEIGKVAPDFSYVDADGAARRVSALRGRKNLLLTFFPKCFTGRCKTHLSSLRDAYPAFLAAGTEIWAVSIDPAEGERGQREFSKSLNLPYPMLPDTGRNICVLYGAAQSTNQLALRQSILIDRDGIVRWIDRNVNAEAHGQDMLAKIAELRLTP